MSERWNALGPDMLVGVVSCSRGESRNVFLFLPGVCFISLLPPSSLLLAH